jgi:hypothetical protein
MKIVNANTRKESKLARMCERIGKNTTPLVMSRKQWIKLNVMYADFCK